MNDVENVEDWDEKLYSQNNIVVVLLPATLESCPNNYCLQISFSLSMQYLPFCPTLLFFIIKEDVNKYLNIIL